jgi:hypothetical protein
MDLRMISRRRHWRRATMITAIAGAMALLAPVLAPIGDAVHGVLPEHEWAHDVAHAQSTFITTVVAEDGEVSATAANTSGTTITVARRPSGVSNGVLRFDTSALPDNATVTVATLRLYVIAKGDADNRGLAGEWYTAFPVDAADYSAVSANSALNGYDITALPTGAYANLALQNLSNVSKTGSTGVRLHINGAAPSGDNSVQVSSLEGVSTQRPQLVVTYTVSSPTPTPTPTPPPSGGSGTCATHDPNAWHGAVGPNGCTYGHEHGSQPPAWVGAMSFSGAFNTSPIENAPGPTDAQPTLTGKHNAMKGYLGTNPIQGGGQFYIRYHAASNVHDRMSRFHSYEIWFKDNSNNVSHWQGWADSGDPDLIGFGEAGAGGRRFACSPEIDIRPETIVRNEGCTNELTEHWYFYPRSGWQPTFSILMEATTFMYQGEYSQTSMTNWRRTGALGTSREASMVVAPGSLDLAGKPAPRGVAFYATQFGEIVTGPSDPRCSAQTTFPAQPTATFFRSNTVETYQNVCLENYLAPTLPGFIEQQGFAPGGEFPNQGVKLPN